MRPHKFLPLAFVIAVALAVMALAQDKVLYEKQSPYTLITVTEDHQGLRTLLFDKNLVRQSVVKVGDPDHLELPYARVVLAGLAFVDNPRRVLIVGLGGGTLPSFLHKHYPQTVIDVVDIDPDVADVARRFFGVREDATLHIHVADGRRFIETAQKPYDIIFLDAYGPDNIPYHLATREFLQAVRKALAPGGIVVGNLWDRHSNSLYDDMVRTYQAVFDELYLFDVPAAGNKILIGRQQKQPIDREALARRAAWIARGKGFRFDLGDLVRSGYHRLDAPWQARILTDADRPKKTE